MANLYFNDCAGMPGSGANNQNLRVITCLAPKAADQLSVTNRERAIIGPGVSGVSAHNRNKFLVPFTPSQSGSRFFQPE